MAIYGNMVGGGSAPLKTLILTDENGNELFGVVTGSEQILTANALTDIREGVVAVTDEGIVTGSAVIPTYHTNEGSKMVKNGAAFEFSTQQYDYTKMQAIICIFNTSLSDTVSADKVVINDNVYDVKSTTSLSVVVKRSTETGGIISLGINNTSGSPCIIRYFMYKELY